MVAFRSKQTNNIILIIILIIAAALRFYALEEQSFWADEGNSVVLATRGTAEIVMAAAADIHPPAYYLILSGWAQAFGLNAFGARSLSAIFGVALVWFIYLIGARLRNGLTGLIAAVLAAVNPFLIYYSQEARMYELLALCAAITAYALLIWLMQPIRRTLGTILYLLFATFGLYTHYAFPIHLIALNIVFFLWVWHSRSKIRKASMGKRHFAIVHWLILQLAVILLYLPWLPTAFRQLTTWPPPPDTLELSQVLGKTIELFVCGPILCSETITFLLVAIVSVVLMMIALLPKWPTGDSWPASLLPLFWLLTPLVAMFLFGIFSPVFFKFLIIVVPAYLLLLAIGIQRLTALLQANTKLKHRRILPSLVPAILIILLALPSLQSLDRYYHDPAVARDDYRSIAYYVKSVANRDDAVILNAPGQLDAFSQYDHGEVTVYPIPSSRPLDEQATFAELDQLINAHNRIYAIYWATEQSDPNGVVEAYLAQQGFKAWDNWIGNLRFVAYNVEPPPEPTQLVWPVQFGETIALDAAGLDALPVYPGDIARVLLRWSTEMSAEKNYKVTLQLLNANNQIVAQVDSEPVGGQRPTSTWQPFESIDDPYGLPVLLATPPGDYSLILAVYDPTSGVRLPVTTNEGISDHLRLGTITIATPQQPPPIAVLPIPHPADETVKGFSFLGHARYKQGFQHAPATPLLSGDSLHLTTFWRADTQPEVNYQFELILDDTPIGRYPLVGPEYPTSSWDVGYPWRGEHTSVLPPAQATDGAHSLSIQLLGPDGGTVGEPIRLEPPIIY